MNDIIGSTMLLVLLSQVSNVQKFHNNLDIVDLSKGYWYIESILIYLLCIWAQCCKTLASKLIIDKL